jgi:hypothetical protein
LSEKETWDDFVKDYPHGKAINPFAIKPIIIKNNYYAELTTPAPTPATLPTPVTLNSSLTSDELEKQIAANKAANPYNPIDLHGGKRKTHRKKKSKNSRKNKSRKTHLKSNRRRR